MAPTVSLYVLRVDAVLPPTVAASTDVTDAPLPDRFVATTLDVVTTEDVTVVLTVLLPTLIVDVDKLTLAPTLIDVVALAVPLTDRPFNVPTDVKEEPVIPVPRDVELITCEPLISYCLPDTRLKSSDAVQASVESTQVRVLSVVPFNVIPPPSAVTSVGVSVSPRIMFLSSTTRFVELTFVVPPLKNTLPETVRSPVIVVLPTATVPSMSKEFAVSTALTVELPMNRAVVLAIRFAPTVILLSALRYSSVLVGRNTLADALHTNIWLLAGGVVVTSIGIGAAALLVAASLIAFAAGTPPVVGTATTPPCGETTVATGFGSATVGFGIIARAPELASVCNKAPPRSIVEPERYRSLQRIEELPRS